MFSYKFKLKLLKIVQIFFKIFNLKIYYSKDKNVLKNININTIIDVGVAKGTNFLFSNFPNSKYLLIEPNKDYFEFIEKNILNKYNAKLFKIGAGKKEENKILNISGPISSLYKRKNFEFKNQYEIKVKKLDDILYDEKLDENVLLKIARGEILILLDPSVEIKGPFIDRIHELLIPSTVGIVGLAGLRTKDLLHFHDGDGESGNMDAMQGYCFALRRCDLEKVGLMRESFRYYRNLDLDFSFQFKERGYSIVADHTLPMELHEHRGWTALSQGEREELSKKNYGRFLKKWRNRTDLLISTK